MKKLIIITAFLFLVTSVFAQGSDTLKPKLKTKGEKENNWSINLTFSDNGFGLGAAKYFKI